MTLKEQAWQSGIILFDQEPGWNETEWPLLEGGWRERHATVVLDHPDDNNNNNTKRQTVVAMGGYDNDCTTTNSVLVLNLAQADKQWRQGPPMNKSRDGHAAVVCNGGVYVMGGDNGESLDSVERIDVNDLLQSSLATNRAHESHWTTLPCRLSWKAIGCCAVAVHNRYIVVIYGYYSCIMDTSTHTVIEGPHTDVPRLFCASAVVGHRIFVVGGENCYDGHDSVEYLEFQKRETASTDISFSSAWTTHPDLVLSNARRSCAVVAVGSCLVVSGGGNRTVQVLDTDRNRVWNLPPFESPRRGCSMVTLANRITVIGGRDDPSCGTLPLMDKNSWCFRRLCEQQWNERYHSLEGSGYFHSQKGSGAQDANGTDIRDANGTGHM